MDNSVQKSGKNRIYVSRKIGFLEAWQNPVVIFFVLTAFFAFQSASLCFKWLDAGYNRIT